MSSVPDGGLAVGGGAAGIVITLIVLLLNGVLGGGGGGGLDDLGSLVNQTAGGGVPAPSTQIATDCRTGAEQGRSVRTELQADCFAGCGRITRSTPGTSRS